MDQAMPLYAAPSHLTRFIRDADVGGRGAGEDSTDPPSPASSTHTDSSRHRVRDG